MSIFLKNVEWSQNQSKIYINIRLVGKKSLDNITIDGKFLKINISPYYCEVFFEHPICVEDSTCKILESNIKFCLKKKTSELWTSLGKTSQSSLTNDSISNEERRSIFCEYEKSVKNDFEMKNKNESTIKNYVIDREIERKNEIRNRIEKTEASLTISLINKVSNAYENIYFYL